MFVKHHYLPEQCLKYYLGIKYNLIYFENDFTWTLVILNERKRINSSLNKGKLFRYSFLTVKLNQCLWVLLIHNLKLDFWKLSLKNAAILILINVYHALVIWTMCIIERRMSKNYSMISCMKSIFFSRKQIVFL